MLRISGIMGGDGVDVGHGAITGAVGRLAAGAGAAAGEARAARQPGFTPGKGSTTPRSKTLALAGSRAETMALCPMVRRFLVEIFIRMTVRKANQTAEIRVITLFLRITPDRLLADFFS